MKTNPTLVRENELMTIVLDICFRIHRLFGPGLYESVYEELFFYEFSKEDIPFTRQQAIPLVYETIKLDIGFRADFVIENKLVVELKSIEALADVHYKQVQTYLKLSNTKLAALVNFNTVYLKDGIKRIINSF